MTVSGIDLRPRFPAHAGLALALTAAADFLLFEQPPGLSLLLFVAMLAGGIAASHPVIRGVAAWKYLLVPLGLAPLLENVSVISVMVTAISLIAFTLAASDQLRVSLSGFLRQVAGFALMVPVSLPLDAVRARAMRQHSGGAGGRLALWLMPIALAAVFVLLFGVANPIVEHWLKLIDLWAVLDSIDVARVLFWVAVLWLVWAFLRPRLPKLFSAGGGVGQAKLQPVLDPKTTTTIGDVIFSRGAIFRALLVFNIIFAAQTVLDAMYLWGGATLPDGMTYAEYAHRGAYPLMVTALLAAAFVLIAMRPGSETSADRTIRRLVYLWTGQNVVLVLSSILRLDLYIGTYALTYLRVAAFTWMGLVAVGLVLIMARIRLERSNGWLVSANLLTSSMTLYACCFVNFASMIGEYNVAHSRDLTGEGQLLDERYLVDFGPPAIPAIDEFIAGAGKERQCSEDAGFISVSDMRLIRDRLAREHGATFAEWRAWTFRDWRLSRYLAANVRPTPLPASQYCPPADRD